MSPTADAIARHYTESQKRALHLLRGYARMYFERPEFYGVRLRAQPLLIGPSGVGKTQLVRDLATELQLPLIRFSSGDWLPTGTRNDSPTLLAIRQFVDTHARGIIHLDELDKYRAGETTTWGLSVLTDIFSLLDRQPASWTPLLTAKLRHRFLVVGSGTFQDLWDSKEREVGFGSETTHQTSSDERLVRRLRKARLIPPELINRFAEPWILIEPYTAADFARLRRAYGLPTAALDPSLAAESGTNFRAIESALGRFVIQQILAETPTNIPEEF